MYSLPPLQVPISGRLSTVNRATKLPPGTPLPDGKRRRAVRLGRVALAVKLVAGRVHQAAGVDGQRVAIVGKRGGKDELDRGRGRLPVDRRIVGDDDALDGNDPVGIPLEHEVPRALQDGRRRGRRRETAAGEGDGRGRGIAVPAGGDFHARHDAVGDHAIPVACVIAPPPLKVTVGAEV